LEDYAGSWIARLCRQDENVFSEGLMEGMMARKRDGYWVAMVIGEGKNKSVKSKSSATIDPED